jgi:hypothetical protein
VLVVEKPVAGALIEGHRLFDFEIIEYDLKIILSCEAGIEQIAWYFRPIMKVTIIEHFQVIGNDEGHDGG